MADAIELLSRAISETSGDTKAYQIKAAAAAWKEEGTYGVIGADQLFLLAAAAARRGELDDANTYVRALIRDIEQARKKENHT